MRTAYDFSPLYGSMIGVDRLADLIATATQRGDDHGGPPYDIEKTGEDAYRLTLATAGFRPDELEIVAEPNLLVVKGAKRDLEEGRRFLHHGLARRAFEQRFELADHVVVRGADYAHGLLTVELAREIPEALKPRRIEIAAGAGSRPAQDNAPQTGAARIAAPFRRSRRAA